MHFFGKKNGHFGEDDDFYDAGLENETLEEVTEPEVTDPPLKDKSGCGSSFSALGVLLSSIAGVALVFKKRK